MGGDDEGSAAIESDGDLLLSKPRGSREASEEGDRRLSECGKAMRQRFLSLILFVTSRLLLRKDRLNGTMGRMLSAFSFAEQRLVISSGDRRLSAVYVSAGDETPG